MRPEEGWTGISERHLEMKRQMGESENKFIDLDWLDVAEKHKHLHNAKWCLIPFMSTVNCNSLL